MVLSSVQFQWTLASDLNLALDGRLRDLVSVGRDFVFQAIDTLDALDIPLLTDTRSDLKAAGHVTDVDSDFSRIRRATNSYARVEIYRNDGNWLRRNKVMALSGEAISHRHHITTELGIEGVLPPGFMREVLEDFITRSEASAVLGAMIIADVLNPFS